MERGATDAIPRRPRSLALRRCIERVGNELRPYLGQPRQPPIKIHGLLRTGTNYLEALLRRNFHVQCLAPWEEGWKHGPCQYVPTCFYVFLVKDPYAWIVSFRNWERLHNRSSATSLAEFARQPLTHPRLVSAWNDVGTPIEAWNRTLASWQAHEGKPNTLFLRYEDLIRDPEAAMAGIRARFGLSARQPAFVDVTSRADTWRTPNPRAPLDVGYYRHEKFLDEFDEPALSLLRAALDRQLLRRFDYRIH
jgi:hypothetical protein